MAKKKPLQPVVPEWSHTIESSSVKEAGMTLLVKASAQEMKDLAKRANVSSINDLSADFTLEREDRNIIHVKGRLRAEVIQPCVVTGEPVKTALVEPFEAWFEDYDDVVLLAKARHERQARVMDAEIPMLDEREAPEPVVDGKIDLGEVAAQQLCLSIDPYPHAEKAEFPVQAEWVSASREENIPPLRRNPFEALKNWKKSKEGG